MSDATRHGVVLVEDDVRMRRRIASAVETEPRLMLRCAVGSLAEGRAALEREKPDVLLIDLGLPDGDGVDLIRAARHAWHDLRILVISVFGDERTVFRAVQAGADGYLLKDGSPEGIAGAIVELIDGGYPLSAPVARYLLRFVQSGVDAHTATDGPGAGQRVDEHPLTEREIEVLKLFARGFNTGEIADLLGLSPHTVIALGRNIHRKLDVRSRAEAVYEAVALGLIRMPE